MLSYRDEDQGGGGGGSDSGMHDELESIIRKQLHHSDERYVPGPVILITCNIVRKAYFIPVNILKLERCMLFLCLLLFTSLGTDTLE